MNESDVAQLYRNQGRPVPAEFQSGVHTPAAKMEKYRRVRKEVDGIKFDSTVEAEAYQVLKLWKAAKIIFGLDLQPEYVLQDGFRDPATGKWHRAVKYVADFRFARMTDQHKIILVDVKGFRTAAFSIKEKLFRARFPEIDLQIWNRQKVKDLARL